MKNYIVYEHISPSGKRYIGITSNNPNRRWGANGQGYSKQPKFFNAILKYGWDNFQHNILYSNLTANEASQKEQELIKYYNTIKNGYNCEFGGLTNKKHSQETIEKLRQLNLGKNNPNYGKTASKETRLKISQLLAFSKRTILLRMKELQIMISNSKMNIGIQSAEKESLDGLENLTRLKLLKKTVFIGLNFAVFCV